MAVDFEAVLGRFTAAVEAGDGHALASLFTPDGVYEDRFYGAKAGREAIAANQPTAIMIQPNMLSSMAPI